MGVRSGISTLVVELLSFHRCNRVDSTQAHVSYAPTHMHVLSTWFCWDTSSLTGDLFLSSSGAVVKLTLVDDVPDVEVSQWICDVRLLLLISFGLQAAYQRHLLRCYVTSRRREPTTDEAGAV